MNTQLWFSGSSMRALTSHSGLASSGGGTGRRGRLRFLIGEGWFMMASVDSAYYARLNDGTPMLRGSSWRGSSQPCW